MLRRLGNRLALSHTLPILIVVPLLGVVLLYQLERNYFLNNLAADLAARGALIAEFTAGDQPLWRDPAQAQLLLSRLQTPSSANMMLLDSQARVLASTQGDGTPPSGQMVDLQLIHQAAAGQTAWAVDRNAAGQDWAVDVVVPVRGENAGLVGFVRLSHRLTDLQQRLNEQRWLVLITLFAGAGIALVLALILARSLAAPLLRLTEVVARFNPEKPPETLSESGPDELKALAAAFNRQSRHLYELERTRKMLLSGIVHELGRPLGSIKIAAQTIAQSKNAALASELATGIDDQVDQLHFHLDDLALLGELELHGLNLVCETVDLADLLEAQRRRFARLAEAEELTLSYQLLAPLPLIQADPKRVSQILDNLLHNACKYTPPGGQVTVSAAQANASGGASAILVRVADSGPGIAPEEQERIFELFYRSPDQCHRRQGMGIGLALARQLAEAHNGSLCVESRRCAGAAFVLRLPVHTCRQEERRSPHPEPSSVKSSLRLT